MKVSYLVSSALIVGLTWAKNNHHPSHSNSHRQVSVYDLSMAGVDQEIPLVDEKDAYIYLSDRFDCAESMALGKGKKAQELVKFIDHQYEQRPATGKKSNIVISIDGVEDPDLFFGESRSASFKYSGENSRLVSKLSNRMVHSLDYEMIQLTNEINLLTHQSSSEHSLIVHFKFFNEKLVKIWQSFKSSALELLNKRQVVLGETQGNIPMMNLINDRFFIAELSELIHLKDAKLVEDDVVFVHLNSLLSVGKKAGFDSNTYKFSNKVLADFLEQLAQDYELTLFVSPVVDKKAPLSPTLQKRSNEFKQIFEENDLAKKVAGSSCFASKEACDVSTSGCNSRGSCSQSGGCWSCACKPSFNKTTQKTTRWAGADCSKKDISSQANLLLWSSLGLLAVLAGGFQLLYSLESDPLPGVLDAATFSKKS